MPGPSSRTQKRTAEGISSAPTSTVERSPLNFTALEIRLRRTCRSLPRSARTAVEQASRVRISTRLPGLRTDERDGVLDHALGRDRLEVQLEPAGFDLRQIEDVVDQREQVPAARQHVLDEFGVLRRECLPAFFEEQLGKADDRVQWCAQLVR